MFWLGPTCIGNRDTSVFENVFIISGEPVSDENITQSYLHLTNIYQVISYLRHFDYQSNTTIRFLFTYSHYSNK